MYLSGWGYRNESKAKISMPSMQKKYCKATDKVVKCEECKKRFHASCANRNEKESLELGSDDESWYCKAECGLCSGAVLDEHKEVQMTALSSLKLCEIRLVVPGFVPNVIFFQLPRFILF